MSNADRLTRLSLSMCPISNKQVQATLQNFLAYESDLLKSLDLSGTFTNPKFTCETMKTILENKVDSLTDLTIGYNSVFSKGASVDHSQKFLEYLT